jgi:2-dehydro-3-deoxygalactonokinase
MTGSVGPMILLDVGSTNTRAWLVADGRVLERRTAPVGVRQTALSGSSTAVRGAVTTVVAELSAIATPAALAAAGMITSSQGLLEVPHVVAPASVGDLGRAVVRHRDDSISTLPILLVPGVRTRGLARDLTADVMRGEETLVAGLFETGNLAPGGRLLNAGSHWKLIDTDAEARVTRSRTSLGGEVMHAVQANTLISASLPQGPLARIDYPFLEDGAAAARQHGLLRALFGIRLLDQLGEATPDERLSWLAGACIAEDLRGFSHGDAAAPGTRIVVSGPGAMPVAWSHLLHRAGHASQALDAGAVEAAFIAGLVAIVAAARREDR